jgi:hypothetical protein
VSERHGRRERASNHSPLEPQWRDQVPEEKLAGVNRRRGVWLVPTFPPHIRELTRV